MMSLGLGWKGGHRSSSRSRHFRCENKEKFIIYKMNKYEADYQPRRCDATNRLIPAADYRSVQIPISEVSGGSERARVG